MSIEGTWQRVEKLNMGRRSAVVFIGPPTSGKTSQTKFLGEAMDGKVLRGKDVLPEAAAVHEKTRDLIDDQQFVPALHTFLRREQSPKIILDNIPRTPAQSEVLVEWAREENVDLYVVRLMLTEPEVLQRSESRMACPDCGAAYHPDLKPPMHDGFCDVDGRALERRPGDQPELLKKSYAMHMEQADQIIEALAPVAKVFQFSAAGKISNVSERMLAELPGDLFVR